MVVAHAIKCSNCGAPVEFTPGEIVTTCKYCGFTTIVETGKAFTFEHSLLLNKYNENNVETPIREWMRSGFLKPADLERKSKIIDKRLIYLPFWVISVQAKTVYKGIFERITPAVVKDGILEKEYNWLILAREASAFPTREYNVPLEGKVNYDFRKIEGYAQVLNSEIDRDEAVNLAKQQIEAHHRFLLQQEVDKILEARFEFNVKQAVYLHAPIWFIKYEYRGKGYSLLLDGATGTVVKGEIPQKGFGIF
ncbi:MAG: zinc ribbon domain-containing protein [Candidatus Bathyarchaeia archaeon]